MNIINPVQINKSYNINSQSSLQSQPKLLQNQPVKDVFVLSQNNINFGSKNKIYEKFYPFYRDLHSYMQKTPEANIKEIEKIVQKYSPTTTVAPMSEIEEGANVHGQHKAYFKNMIYFSSDGKIIDGDKVIYVNLPKDSSKRSKSSLIEDLSHEMTHILQEESSDRLSKTDFFNEYLKDKEINPITATNIQVVPKVYNIAEINILKPLLKVIDNKENIPQPVADTSKNMLDRIYSFMTPAKSCEDYIFMIINASIDHIQSACMFPLDRKLMLKYVALIAEKEREAYSNANNVIKNEMGIKGKTDFDLRVKLFEVFAQKSKEMAKE